MKRFCNIIFILLLTFFSLLIFSINVFACVPPGLGDQFYCNNLTNRCCTPVVDTNTNQSISYACETKQISHDTIQTACVPQQGNGTTSSTCKPLKASDCTEFGSTNSNTQCCANDPTTKQPEKCDTTQSPPTCVAQQQGTDCAQVNQKCGALSPSSLTCCTNPNIQNQTLSCLDKNNAATDNLGLCQYQNLSITGAVTPLPSQILPPSPPCASAIGSSGCTSFDSAFGTWNTDPAGFVNSLFSILLSISGAIAMLIIMISGYKILMSRGDPEKIQGARESLTAAIVGLLFLIFSMVILEIIGVDILKIPGFAEGTGTTTGIGTTSTPIDYGNDANPCSAVGPGPNCGFNSQNSGLFCAGSCGVGGLGNTLYRCTKTANGYTTTPVKDCGNTPNGICLTGNGANVPDYCGIQTTGTGHGL